VALNPREFLRNLFDAAVAVAHPSVCLPPHLPRPADVQGRIVVVGAGKAAAAMAKAAETAWADSLDRVSGIVVTRYGHGAPTQKIEVVEAAHPVPDTAGEAAAARILAAVQGLTADDLVLVLLSGGGSALLALPAPGIDLIDKQQVTRALLACGADIREINCVRKHLSAIKGGRLALAAQPARVLALAISDVAGDDLSSIASGPTVPDPTTREEARAVLARYQFDPPPAVRKWLAGAPSETPKPGDAAFTRCATKLVATAQDALKAAAATARAAGVTPLILGDRIEGEAREVAKALAGIALSCKHHGLPVKPPCVLLSGGETTVTVRGSGRGGRNAEFQLALALALQGQEGIHAIACDTDGIDGSEDNAGAQINPTTLMRAKAQGMDARARLMDNDAYGFFAALDDLVVTGPTLTNINDFRAILIEK
jgi:glycerate 2-kinase